jgi:uncharacterized protein YyaL (SSP411 family)
MKLIRDLASALLVGIALAGFALPPPAAQAREASSSPAHANRLANEKSPYLLQHAQNPVDWYPWGPEAFDKARTEGKLIFLSIGYSTCHWCHVMERESFEDEEVAAILKRHFVAIKVDREERPDIDQVYMTVCQALTGRGGWPLNVLLTPERLPFFAGTYYPKNTRNQHIGLIELLERAQAAWQADPSRLRNHGVNLVRDLSALQQPEGKQAALDASALTGALQLFQERFDEAHGGFGTAPKFPSPHNLIYLIRRHRRTGDAEPLEMAEATLQAMRRGGIFDHVGFGFHRYSTDREWLVPHFEKMLYDQAGLAHAYLEAYQATRKQEYANTAREIFTYVLRNLTDPEGGFYSAEDADSEGEEGKFYLWTSGELMALLGPQEGAFYAQVFGAVEQGNYRDEATRTRTGKNILHLDRALASWAQQLNVTLASLGSLLERSRAILMDARERRVRPLRDDKVITAWNGWMISAFARAARILEEPEYARIAERAANFVLAKMWRDGRLLRRYRAGEAAIPAYAEDYAYLAKGLLDLYTATFDVQHLLRAVDLATQLGERFTGEDGGIFATAADAEVLVFRPREFYDGASPSANSIALEVFAQLALYTGDTSWRDRAEGILIAGATEVGRYPTGHSHFLQAASFLWEPTREIVVAGAPGAADTRGLLAVLARSYLPEAVVLLVPPPPEGSAIRSVAPFAVGMKPIKGRAAAYVCQNFTCQEPVTDPRVLATRLEKLP